jgi:molybdate transport system regulatory protein
MDGVADDGATPDVEARLHAGDIGFEATDATLLRAIDDAGSLNAATDRLGRSYSRAHERLTALESAFGPLVERTRGGDGGGGSRLTGRGVRLLARYTRLRAALTGVAAASETVLDGTVLDRDGELATVGTPVGRLRVLATEPGTAVQVTVRADAVTLHDPEEAPVAAGTSARNRLRGTVVGLDPGEAVATVTVDVSGVPLAAIVTAESAERLGLEPGREVVVTFKSTATRATPREPESSGDTDGATDQ